MTVRTATTAVITAAIFAAGLTACGSNGAEAKPTEKTTVTVAAPTTPTAAPSLSQAETAQQCSVAVSEAAPEWEDWNFDLGNWQDDPRTPEVCQGLADETFPPRGNRAFQDALIDGLELADDPRANQ